MQRSTAHWTVIANHVLYMYKAGFTKDNAHSNDLYLIVPLVNLKVEAKKSSVRLSSSNTSGGKLTFPSLRPHTAGAISSSSGLVTGVVYAEAARDELCLSFTSRQDMDNWIKTLQQENFESDQQGEHLPNKSARTMADVAMSLATMSHDTDSTATRWLMLPCGELSDMDSALLVHGIGEAVHWDQI